MSVSNELIAVCAPSRLERLVSDSGLTISGRVDTKGHLVVGSIISTDLKGEVRGSVS